MPTTDLQQAKLVARQLNAAMDAAADDSVIEVLTEHTNSDYEWRGMRPTL